MHHFGSCHTDIARCTVSKTLKINGIARIVRLPVYSSIHHVEYNTLIAVPKNLQKIQLKTRAGCATVSAFFTKWISNVTLVSINKQL